MQTVSFCRLRKEGKSDIIKRKKICSFVSEWGPVRCKTEGSVHLMRLFDVLGPVMIGPSSSHTAGAARIGYTAQKLLGDVPAEADIGLYGSFATTGRGHGTDRALVAGLLGLRPDDPRLPDSFALAEEAGMKFTIHPVELRAAHPNTTVLTLKSKAGRTLVLKAASVGCLLYTSPSPRD